MTFGRFRHFARLLVLPLVVSLVAACTQTPGASSAPSVAATPSGPAGTLTVAMRGDIQSPHPYLSYDIVGISYRENVFDSLVEWGYDGKIVPGIAESWKVDGTTITFKIRSGVKFHNGDPVTADDVKFSLDTIKSKMRVTVFFSPNVPIAGDVQSLLTEYQYAAKGKIDVENVDPERSLSRAKELFDRRAHAALEEHRLVGDLRFLERLVAPRSPSDLGRAIRARRKAEAHSGISSSSILLPNGSIT